jgi:hypothetical protein
MVPEHHRTRITRESARRWRVHFVRASTINLNGSLKKLFPTPAALVPSHSIESESTRLSGRPELATRDHGLAQILFDEASKNPGHSGSHRFQEALNENGPAALLDLRIMQAIGSEPLVVIKRPVSRALLRGL